MIFAHLRSREENNSLKNIIRELKNHDDDRKWVTVYYASKTSRFRRGGVVDDAKQTQESRRPAIHKLRQV